MKMKKEVGIIMIVFMLSLLSISGCFEPSVRWDYPGLSNRVMVTVPLGEIYEGSTVPTISNFPLFVPVNGDLSYNKNEVAFTDKSGVKLPFEIVHKDGVPYGYWVNLPLLNDDNNKFHMYFNGNSPKPNNPWGSYTGVWHLDETTENYYDSTVNDIDSGTFTVTSRTETGVLGYCPSFVGSKKFIDLGHSELIEGSLLHIEMWFNVVNASYENFLMSWEPRDSGGQYCADKGWNLEVGWNIKDVLLQSGDYSRNLTSSEDNLINDNTWHHLCAEYDGSLVRFYIDGVETSAYGHTPYGYDFFQQWTPDPDSKLYIGGNGFTLAPNQNSKIDEVRFSHSIKGEDWAYISYQTQNGLNTLIYGTVETQ